VVEEIIRPADAQEVAEQSGIEEVELGRLDQPLGVVLMMRLNQCDNVTGSEERDPFLDRRMSDASVCSKRGVVQEVAGASGAEPHKARECIQVSYAGEQPKVTFDIRTQVTVQPWAGFEGTIVDWGKEA
jgi:hypothetical protein